MPTGRMAFSAMSLRQRHTCATFRGTAVKTIADQCPGWLSSIDIEPGRHWRRPGNCIIHGSLMVDCTATSERRDAEIEQWQFLGIYCGGEHLEIAPGIDVWNRHVGPGPADQPAVNDSARPAQKKVWVRETVSGETHHCPCVGHHGVRAPLVLATRAPSPRALRGVDIVDRNLGILSSARGRAPRPGGCRVRRGPESHYPATQVLTNSLRCGPSIF